MLCCSHIQFIGPTSIITTRQMANYECNAISPVRITHHFAARILSEIAASPTRGAIFFTSSPAGFMPCPITVMYGATKAFLTEFATSIAAEVCVLSC